MKTCDGCQFADVYNAKIYEPCRSCEVTKQERKEFFDTLDDKLKTAKGQFEICDKCKQNTIEELEKIKAEIREWYWQADKQKISKDPCVVDAMTDLFIRTVDNHISELKGEQGMSFKYCLVQYLEWQAQNKKHKKLLKCEDCPFYKKCKLKGE